MSYSQELSEPFHWVPRKMRKICRSVYRLNWAHATTFYKPRHDFSKNQEASNRAVELWLGSPLDRFSYKGRGHSSMMSTNGWITCMSPKLSTPRKVKIASVYKARWLCRPHVSLYVTLQIHAETYIEFWGVRVRDNYRENSLSLNNYETHE